MPMLIIRVIFVVCVNVVVVIVVVVVVIVAVDNAFRKHYRTKEKNAVLDAKYE